MQLRNFMESDSALISSWVLCEEDLYKWSANILCQWPLKSETLFNHYKEGIAQKTVVPLVAVDDDGIPFGHCFLRFPFEDKSIVRIGFVIVDPKIRGKAYGRKLLSLVEDFAKKEYGATKLSLGVFTNNLPAMKCYLSMNYIPDGTVGQVECPFGKWKVVEMLKDLSQDALVFRKAESSDVAQIQAFVDQAKIVMDRQGIPQWDEIYPIRSDFELDCQNKELYVGLVHGKPALCFTLNQMQDEEYFKVQWQNSGEDFIVVHRLCVSPEFQGRGFGLTSCRLIEALAWSKGASSIRLDAFSQNPISLSMYQKLGYVTKGFADWRKGRFKLMEKTIEF